MSASGSREWALRVFCDGKFHGVGIGCQRLDRLHDRAAMRQRDNAISQLALAEVCATDSESTAALTNELAADDELRRRSWLQFR